MPSPVLSKRFLAGVALLSVFAPVSAHAQGAAYSFREWSNTSVTDRVRVAPRLPCDAVTSLTLVEWVEKGRSSAPAAAFTCVVELTARNAPNIECEPIRVQIR